MARAKDVRRMETQRQQRIAEKAGTVSPRGLARGIAKAMRRAKDEKPGDIKGWRQMVSQLPATGRKYLHKRGA